VNQVQEFLARVERLSPTDWAGIVSIYLKQAYGARRLGALTATEGLITSYRRGPQASSAISEANESVREAARARPLPPDWRMVSSVAGIAAAALVVAKELQPWELECLYSPFEGMLPPPKGDVSQVRLPDFYAALRKLDATSRDQVIHRLGDDGAASLAAADAIVEANLDDDTNSAEAAARGATVAAGQHADIHAVQGAAQAAVRALMARQKITTGQFDDLWQPFATVIPADSLSGQPVLAGVGRKASASGCVIPMAMAACVLAAIGIGFGYSAT
jgi:hypothetical protein